MSVDCLDCLHQVARGIMARAWLRRAPTTDIDKQAASLPGYESQASVKITARIETNADSGSVDEMSEDVEETKSSGSSPARGGLGTFATMPKAVRPWMTGKERYAYISVELWW